MKTLIVSFGLVFAALAITPASAQWGGGYGYGHHHGGYGYGWDRGYHRDWYRPYNPYWRRHRYWRRGW